MAFRREFFAEAGLFDPALDVGTPTNGGGDLEMFLRVMKTGHALVYEPLAMVRHRHRRTYEDLRHRSRTTDGVLRLSRTAPRARYPEDRARRGPAGLWWMWWWHARRLVRSRVRPAARAAESRPRRAAGVRLVGLSRYAAARLGGCHERLADRGPVRSGGTPRCGRFAPLTDVDTRIPRRRVVPPRGSSSRRADARRQHRDRQCARADLGHAPARRSSPAASVSDRPAKSGTAFGGRAKPALSPDVRVSVVIPSCNRPDDLRRCLASLEAQRGARPLEVIVVDNRPGPATPTAAVAREFEPA